MNKPLYILCKRDIVSMNMIDHIFTLYYWYIGILGDDFADAEALLEAVLTISVISWREKLIFNMMMMRSALY
jgi:hypothetical protein